ncbi:hypothetical protein ANTRET_LOCUS656 [Anthophora retusa]
MTDVISVLRMPRPVHLVLLLFMLVLVASLEDPSEPARAEAELPNNVNDLDADATSWGYSRPWRYGWKGGWGGWRGGWGWGGKVWTGRVGWY